MTGYMYQTPYLAHYGVKGMKWGVRKQRNNVIRTVKMQKSAIEYAGRRYAKADAKAQKTMHKFNTTSDKRKRRKSRLAKKAVNQLTKVHKIDIELGQQMDVLCKSSFKQIKKDRRAGIAAGAAFVAGSTLLGSAVGKLTGTSALKIGSYALRTGPGGLHDAYVNFNMNPGGAGFVGGLAGAKNVYGATVKAKQMRRGRKEGTVASKEAINRMARKQAVTEFGAKGVPYRDTNEMWRKAGMNSVQKRYNGVRYEKRKRNRKAASYNSFVSAKKRKHFAGTDQIYGYV